MLSATLRPSAISSDLQSLVFKSEKLDAAIAKYEDELESTIRLKEAEASASSDRYTAAFKGAQQRLKETKRVIEGHLAVLGPEVTRSLLSAVDSSHSSCEELRAAGERHAAAAKSVALGKDTLIGAQKELVLHLKERCRGAEVELKTSILASRHLSDVLFSVRRYVLNVMTERAEWQQHYGLNPNDMMPEEATATAAASDTFLGTCEKLLDALRKSEEPRVLGATRAATQKRQARLMGTFSPEHQLAQSVRNTNLLAMSSSSSPEPAILDATGTFGGGTTNRSFSSFPFPPPPPTATAEERSLGKSGVTAPSAPTPFPPLSPSAHLPQITSPTPQQVSIETSPQQHPLLLRKSVSSARFHHYLPSLAPDTNSSNLRATSSCQPTPTTATSFSQKRLGSVSPHRAHSSRMLSTANSSTINNINTGIYGSSAVAVGESSSPTSLGPSPNPVAQHNQRQTIGFARTPSLSMLQHRNLDLVGAGGGGGSADDGGGASAYNNSNNSFSDFAAATNKLIGQIRDAKRGQSADPSGSGNKGGGGGVTSPITFVPPPIQPQCANAPRQGADTADSVALNFIQRAQMLRVADKEQEAAMTLLLGRGGGNDGGGAPSFSLLSSANRTGANDSSLDVVRCGERSWRVRGGDSARWVKPKEELALLKLVLSSTAISSGDDVSSLLDALAAAHQEKEEMKSAIADTLGLRCRHMKDSLAKLRSDVVSFSTLHLPHMVSTLEKAVSQWVDKKAPSFFDAIHRSATEAAVRDALEAQRAEIMMNSASGGGRNRNRLSVSGHHVVGGDEQRRLSNGSKRRVSSFAAKGAGIGGALDLEGVGGASSGESSRSPSNGRQRDTSMGNLFYGMGIEGSRGGGGDSPSSLSFNSHGALRSFASSYLTSTSNGINAAAAAAGGRKAAAGESSHKKRNENRSKGTPSRRMKRGGGGGDTPLSTHLSPDERGSGMVRSPARSPGGGGTIGAAREKFLEQQRLKQAQTIKQQERLIGLQQQQISLLREQLDAAKGLALRQRKRQFYPPTILTLKKEGAAREKEENPAETAADIDRTKDLLGEAQKTKKESEISGHAEEIHVQTHVNHVREATEADTNESLLPVDRAPNIGDSNAEEDKEEEAHPRTLKGASQQNGDERNTQPILIEIKSDLFTVDDTKSKEDIAQLGSVMRELFETLSTRHGVDEEAARLKLTMGVTPFDKSSSKSTQEEQFIIRRERAGGIRLVVDGVSYLICVEDGREDEVDEEEAPPVEQKTNGQHHSGCGEAPSTELARSDDGGQTKPTTSMSAHLQQEETTPSVVRDLVDLFEETNDNHNDSTSYPTSTEGTRSAVVVRQGLNGRHDNNGSKFARHGLKKASATNRTSSLTARRPWSRPFYTIIVGSGGGRITNNKGTKDVPSLSSRLLNETAMHPPCEEGTEVDDEYIMNRQRELDEKIAAALEMTERLTNASKQFMATYAEIDDSSSTAFSPSPPRHQQILRSSVPTQRRHFGIIASSPTVRGTSPPSTTYGTRILEVLSASPSPRRMHTYGEVNRAEVLVKSAVRPPSGHALLTAFSPTRPTAQNSRADGIDAAMSTIREVQSARPVARHPLILENEAERENTPASRRSQKHFARAKY